MLNEYIMELVTASEAKDRERTYRKLERIGVDRASADEMASYFILEEKQR